MKQPSNATKQDLAIIAKIEVKDNQYCPATKEELQTLIKYEDISLDTINTSAITDMSRLFMDAKATKRKDFSGINTWDTSSVTDMSYMFAGCERFNEELGADIPATSLVGKLLKSSKKSRFITSNVTTMSHMFDGCSDFNKPVKLDTHNVTDMSSMFKDCIEFNSLIDLDTSNVVNMNRMFCTCRMFNQALNFNTKSVKDMSYMFAWCRSFNQALNFNTENVENFAAFLSEATKFAQPFTLNTSKAKKLNYLLYATHFNHPITIDLASAENINYMFKNCSKLTHTPKLENLNNVKSAKGVFENCRALKDIPDMSAYSKEEPKSASSEKKYKPTTKDELKELCDNEEINLGDIDTSLITDMSGLFWLNQRENFSGIDTWDTSNVTDMSSMFYRCENFNEPLNFDTKNVTDMSSMFYCCENFNEPLNFDTKNVTDMSYMFYRCENFNQTLNFDTSNVTSMSYMFSGCENFNQTLNFDTSNVTDMSYMFYRCENFNQPLNFDTSNVSKAINMFKDCDSLSAENIASLGRDFHIKNSYNASFIIEFIKKNDWIKKVNGKYQPQDKDELKALVYIDGINLDEIDTSLITDMGELFSYSVRQDFSGINTWDTSSVTDMSRMFDSCDTFNETLKFDTSKVTDMSSMFSNCSSFNQPINFDTSNVTDMSSMFSGCANFNQALNFDTSNVTNMSSMFYDCSSLTHKPDFDMSSVEEQEDMFNGCSNLTNIEGDKKMKNFEELIDDLVAHLNSKVYTVYISVKPYEEEDDDLYEAEVDDMIDFVYDNSNEIGAGFCEWNDKLEDGIKFNFALRKIKLEPQKYTIGYVYEKGGYGTCNIPKLDEYRFENLVGFGCQYVDDLGDELNGYYLIENFVYVNEDFLNSYIENIDQEIVDKVLNKINVSSIDEADETMYPTIFIELYQESGVTPDDEYLILEEFGDGDTRNGEVFAVEI